MALYAGDRGKAVLLTVSTGSVLGTSVASARLMVRRPDGSEAEWAVTPGSATSSSVVLTHVLPSDGSGVSLSGSYYVRAWLYDAGAALLCDTDEGGPIEVRPSRHTWPT